MPLLDKEASNFSYHNINTYDYKRTLHRTWFLVLVPLATTYICSQSCGYSIGRVDWIVTDISPMMRKFSMCENYYTR